MTTDSLPPAGLAPDRPASRVRGVATDRPWAWLAAGWQDMLACRPIALAYGGAVCLAGWVLSLLLFEAGTLWAILPTTSGFFLVGPLLAAGLYEASRVREAGRAPTLADILAPFRRNGSQIALIGVALLVVHLFWVRIAGLIFMLFFGMNGIPSLERLPQAMLQSGQLLPFLVIGTGFGCVLAAASFAISALSLPMLVDREISALEAITVSIQAVLENWRPMLLWAGLIVVFTGLALVPFYLGLVLVFPLVGHATWHAYRDIVAR
ncbi:DUF2189 domain-containing protein [Paracraurococcus ruber]|uniref:DUF2189 domain-containing protein n=1 Tax=Paracraurococcus ruber TaxID=77675 RepID=A0ABS1CZR3_9PROT|nr:DUF2189 domain-containing protein [Paracraurococcus ruber]MBK1659402.1 hypothetical protein [Paracraurococcus ruber]TDG30493.1 DUF2189 domain-containing protein [Paracraurococcus ruber]